MITMVDVTATPYAEASALDERNPITIAMQATISAQLMTGTYTCPKLESDMCLIRCRGA